MKKQDLIYQDREYEIYKNSAGDIGTFIPMDCLEIIDIAITQLGEWKNGGFAEEKDYAEIIEKVVEKLRGTIQAN